MLKGYASSTTRSIFVFSTRVTLGMGRFCNTLQRVFGLPSELCVVSRLERKVFNSKDAESKSEWGVGVEKVVFLPFS